MNKTLKQRIVTAVILMLCLIVATTQLPPFYFALLISLVVLVGAWEWTGFISLETRQSRLVYLTTMAAMLAGLFVLLGVTPGASEMDSLRVIFVLVLGLLFWLIAFLMLWGYPENSAGWNDKSKIALMGLCALLPTWTGIVVLKYLFPHGFLVLGLIVMVAAVDVGAYFAGTNFGHTKLAPQLSPNKSWEGVWGGLATCFLLGLLLIWGMHNYLLVLERNQVLLLVAASFAVTFFAVTGDLLESMLKRNCHIKDSGSILPGHGGLLDRVDALMAVTPVFVLIVLLTLTGIG